MYTPFFLAVLGVTKKENISNYKPIGAAPRGHFFCGGGGGVWAKKVVTLRGLRISEKKEILRKPTVL
jgi:hypothetical protein